ncbi:MAG: response regulator [Thermoguttaceae bacterium]|jgi:FixJ family two-component response regulator
MEGEAVVWVVAGDSKARRALAARLKLLGLGWTVCRSADEFFEVSAPGRPGCVLLDVSRPEADLELLERRGARGQHRPVVGISGSADVPTAVRAMKLGAFDFLDQSCTNRQLAETIAEAIAHDAENRREIGQAETSRRRLSRLDDGLRQVLDLLLAGCTNREMAVELDLSIRAIEERRAKVMRTMRAKSLPDLVRQTLVAEGTRLRAE